MNIRSKHGAITACCATFENVVHSKIHTHIRHPTVHQLSTDTQFVQSKELPSSISRNSIFSCILFGLVLIIHNPIATTALTPALASRREMEANTSGFIRNFSIPSPSLFKYPYRSRIKRTILPRPERHLWTPDLVTFVCEELTDPCQRAAFLRRHAYHEICSDVPPLYLLPHIDHHTDVDDVIEGSAQSSAQLCTSKDKGVRSTDGLFRFYLDSPGRCRQSLQSLDTTIRSSLSSTLEMFVDILERSFCFLPNSTDDTMLEECVHCRKAYWSWVCTTTFPIFFPVAKLPHLDDGAGAIITASPDTTTTPEATSVDVSTDVTREAGTETTTTTPASVEQLKKALVAAGSGEKFVLQRVPPCSSWCTQVETLCPYFNPSDATSNGGEPTFLCDESHYQYAPPQSARMGGHYHSCELDCCFTEQDLLMDVISLADTYVPATAATVSALLPSSSKNSSLRHQSSTSEQRASLANDKGDAIREEEEYLGLTARCLHQQLSESLGVQSGFSPLQHLSQNSASSKSAEPNAFVFSVTLLSLTSVAAEVLY